MAYDVNYDDLDYGDETRTHGDYVGLPHDEDTDGVPEGQAVSFDGTTIVAASAGEPVVGVLYTYQYYTDNTGGETVDQGRNATVKTSGTVKAEVESTVAAGDALEAGVTTAGVFDTSDATDSEQANFIALSDARQQDNDNPNGGTGEYYAEVLIR